MPKDRSYVSATRKPEAHTWQSKSWHGGSDAAPRRQSLQRTSKQASKPVLTQIVVGLFEPLGREGVAVLPNLELEGTFGVQIHQLGRVRLHLLLCGDVVIEDGSADWEREMDVTDKVSMHTLVTRRLLPCGSRASRLPIRCRTPTFEVLGGQLEGCKGGDRARGVTESDEGAFPSEDIKVALPRVGPDPVEDRMDAFAVGGQGFHLLDDLVQSVLRVDDDLLCSVGLSQFGLLLGRCRADDVHPKVGEPGVGVQENPNDDDDDDDDDDSVLGDPMAAA